MLNERHYAEMLDTLAEMIAAKVASRLTAQKQIRVLSREMTPAEKRIAAAHLRGGRLPIEEPTVTTQEGLR